MNSRLKIKEITLIGILTALGVVCSAWLRIPLIGNVKLDLSYIVLTVAIMKCGRYGSMFVGGMSAMLESILFAANGLSLSWVIANVVIAFVASFFYKKDSGTKFIIGIVLGCVLGLFVVKTLIECTLFNISLLVRIPNNGIACLSDCVCMIVGYFVGKRFA